MKIVDRDIRDIPGGRRVEAKILWEDSNDPRSTFSSKPSAKEPNASTSSSGRSSPCGRFTGHGSRRAPNRPARRPLPRGSPREWQARRSSSETGLGSGILPALEPAGGLAPPRSPEIRERPRSSRAASIRRSCFFETGSSSRGAIPPRFGTSFSCLDATTAAKKPGGGEGRSRANPRMDRARRAATTPGCASSSPMLEHSGRMSNSLATATSPRTWRPRSTAGRGKFRPLRSAPAGTFLICSHGGRIP